MNVLSNTHNNSRPQVGSFETNLSTSSRAYQCVVSYYISYSYDCTKSYPMNSVFFQVIKSFIGNNLSTY